MKKFEEDKSKVVEILTVFSDDIKHGGRKPDHELIEALASRCFDFDDDRARRLSFAIVTAVEQYIHTRKPQTKEKK